MQVPKQFCPHCGAPMKARPPYFRMTKVMRKMFDILYYTYDTNRHKRVPVSRYNLFHKLYDGKLRSCATLSSNLVRLKVILKGTEFKVQTVYKKGEPHWWIIKSRLPDIGE